MRGKRNNWNAGRQDGDTEEFGFLIVPEFTLYGLFPAIEALRVANQNSGKKLYEWHLISEDGKPVTAANEMTVAVDNSIDDCPDLAIVFAVIGNHPVTYCSPKLEAWLRKLDRHGSRLGAFDSGAFLLASAGVLRHHEVALHWETIPVFRELYPTVKISEQLYNIDATRITCAGGSASLDLMLNIIGKTHGLELAEIVSNGFVHGRQRSGSEEQRPGYSMVVNQDSRQLRAIVEYIENNIEAPKYAADIAADCGISVRKMERLVRTHFGMSPTRFYLKQRLKFARNYLFYSTMSIQEISLACGFSSTSVFCRTFKKHIDCTPGEFRDQYSTAQLNRFTRDYGDEEDVEIAAR